MLIGITGATGFLGTALAKAAAARGHGIVAFSRQKDISLPWTKEVRPLQMEGGGNAIVPSNLDALVHLSGESVMGYWTPGRKRRIRESRVDLTLQIVESMRHCAAPPKTFVCASAVGVYGDRGDEWLTEAAARGEGFLADVCAEWEDAARGALDLDTRVVMLRTGLVLGREGGAWPQLRRVFNARLGSRLGNGRQWVPWIHLDDEVGIILEAVENPAYNGPVNLTAPNPVTNSELTNQIASALKKPKFIPVPSFALKVVMGEASSMVLASLRAKPEVALGNGYTFRHPELKGALESLV